MLINVRTQLDLFDFNDFLLFTGFVCAFLGFIFKFAIIEYFANRWVCMGLDFNKIKAKIFGFTDGVKSIKNPKLFALRVNAAYLWRENRAINSRAVNYRRRITSWTCYVTLL